MDSVKDADEVIFCDTGSTDGTQDILRLYGATVHDIQVSPFRFDLARTMSLMHVPKDTDVAICLDIDDIMQPNWRKVIEDRWEPNTTMLRYQYIYNWEDYEQTKPRLTIWGFKAHKPDAYVWKYPIHEILQPTMEEHFVSVDDILVKHYPDREKAERLGRISLFEVAKQEMPLDSRVAHLYGRELYFHGRYDEAILELKRHLDITKAYDEETPNENPETRASTCRLIARCYMGKNGDPNVIMIWLTRALAEYPSKREAWMDLADAWFRVKDYALAYAYADRGLKLNSKEATTEIDDWCWDERAEKLHADARDKLFGGVD